MLQRSIKSETVVPPELIFLPMAIVFTRLLALVRRLTAFSLRLQKKLNNIKINESYIV